MLCAGPATPHRCRQRRNQATPPLHDGPADDAERAAATAWRTALLESLRHRLLAMVYIQLFSPSETWFLGRQADQLYLLLNHARKHDWQIQHTIKSLVDTIIADYALARLESSIGPLSFRWIVTGSFALPDDLDYLKPEARP